MCSLYLTAIKKTNKKNALACDCSFQSLDLSSPLSIARFTTSNQHCLYATHDVQEVNAVSHSPASPTVHSHIQTEQDSKWRGAFLFSSIFLFLKQENLSQNPLKEMSWPETVWVLSRQKTVTFRCWGYSQSCLEVLKWLGIPRRL